MGGMRRASLAVLLAALAGCASHAPLAGAWPEPYVQRLGAQALLQQLNAELLSHDSATTTLERWCAGQHLADVPRIRAVRDPGTERPAEPDVRRALQAGDAEPLRYRHVQLLCGDAVLSEAENWYVPARLTAAMNAELERSDAPFGRVVQPLGFQRRTLAVELPWQPLPADWSSRPYALAREPSPLDMPAVVLVHRAVLTRADGLPFSYVVERYRREALARAAGIHRRGASL